MTKPLQVEPEARVVFMETIQAIRVLAVAHDKRRPGYWFGRV